MRLRARVLASPADRPIPRHVVDWLVTHQDKTRILVPQALLDHPKQLARLRHAPFEPVPGAAADLARSIAGLIGQPPADRPADTPPVIASRAPGSPGAPGWAVEAAVIALVERAAVVVPHADLFPGLIPISAWSMNVPATPTDGVLARHFQVAAGLPDVFRDHAEAALAALSTGDARGLDRVRRERRRRARTDGPERFKGLRARSAGLRPAVVYLDLVPAFAAAAGGPIHLLQPLERPVAMALTSMAGALFL